MKKTKSIWSIIFSSACPIKGHFVINFSGTVDVVNAIGAQFELAGISAAEPTREEKQAPQAS